MQWITTLDEKKMIPTLLRSGGRTNTRKNPYTGYPFRNTLTPNSDNVIYCLEAAAEPAATGRSGSAGDPGAQQGRPGEHAAAHESVWGPDVVPLSRGPHARSAPRIHRQLQGRGVYGEGQRRLTRSRGAYDATLALPVAERRMALFASAPPPLRAATC